ncbi:hypothetical protein [Kitasatospora sp. NPDC059827]|uniref:hypothetical protein n=1 Tax=Kitasatospora sp. NPDC059827 TaxID=3346964 RepID=UPI00365DC238
MDQRERLPVPTGATGATGAIPAVLLLGGHAPWWAVALLAVPAAVRALLDAVLPQSSADRLEWWRDRRRHRRLRERR